MIQLTVTAGSAADSSIGLASLPIAESIRSSESEVKLIPQPGSEPACAQLPQLPALPQRWEIRIHDIARSELLAREARVPLVVAELLIAAGIGTAEEATRFLNPEIGHLHDPFQMRGMDAAVERLETAIAQGESILLYGDYDVDGTTAVVLLKTAIEMIARSDGTGCKVSFHVPHRLREGYGMQAAVLRLAAADGVRLVISVDTGMRAFAEAQAARELGLDLIITDHHLPEAGDAIPDALAVLNPNQPGCGYPEKSLCGAAIAFKLAQALLERHDRKQGTTRSRDKVIPSFLKMVAIATVADAVPLRGENRALAALGIRELHHPAGLGLRALFKAAGIDPAAKKITSFDLGFRLGPRINAAGRMDVAAEVVELFTTRDPARAETLALKLELLNTERRAAEAEILKEVEQRLASDNSLKGRKMLVMCGEKWHRGIIGILASRVVERTAKPALVVSIEDGVAYGSGRSVDGFPLLEAIESCAELYTRFGGHAFAVGFALPAELLPEMEQRLYEFAAIKLHGKEAQQLLRIHAELPLERATTVLAGWLRKLEPVGHGNPEPVFLARNVRLLGPVRLMKERHIRLELRSIDLLSTGALAKTFAPTQAVGWNCARRADELKLEQGRVIDLAYRLRENDHLRYGGLQIEIAGMRLAEI